MYLSFSASLRSRSTYLKNNTPTQPQAFVYPEIKYQNQTKQKKNVRTKNWHKAIVWSNREVSAPLPKDLSEAATKCIQEIFTTLEQKCLYKQLPYMCMCEHTQEQKDFPS